MALTARKHLYIYVVCVCCVTIAESLSRPSTMVFENNQYKNVVVALHDSVAEDRSLIETLKNTMINASKYLYTATRHRAYFKEITILLPSSWTPDASYSAPTNETINMADVVISNPSRSTRSLPQARSYAGCGKQGVHVFLTQEFLTNARVVPYFRNPAKFFIHAFAQFRWGVFQEYSEEGETEYYFSLTSGRPEAIRCVYGLRGLVQKFDANHTICYSQTIDPTTGLYPPDCKWRPYPYSQRVKASIMDNQWIKEIETFCDDDNSGYTTLHNYEAPSKHNRLCGHRSTWAVIMGTDDFNNNANPPVNLTDAELTPTFKVMRSPTRRKRAVIAIDTSGFNDGYRLSELHKRVGRALHGLAEDTYDIGVTHFGELSSASLPVRRIRSADDINIVTRELLNIYMDKRKRNVTFEDAIKDVLKDLGEHEDMDALGKLVILTSNASMMEQNPGVRSSAKERGLILNVVGVNGEEIYTSPLHVDANIFHEGLAIGSSVTDHLRHILFAEGVAAIHVPVVVKHLHIKVAEPAPVVGYVEIDPSIGRNTIFEWTYTTETPDVKLTSPTGEWYGPSSTHSRVDTELRVVTLVFPLAESGSWKYELQATPGNDLELSVTSLHRTDIKDDPIVIKTELSSAAEHVTLFVDITSGTYPVVGLNVSATVTSPGGKNSEVILQDTGAGADITKQDGVYSRYFTKLDESGLYHVTIDVVGTDGDVFVKVEGVSVLSDTDGLFKKTLTKHVVPWNMTRRVYAGTFFHAHRQWVYSNNGNTGQPVSKDADTVHNTRDDEIDSADTGVDIDDAIVDIGEPIRETMPDTGGHSRGAVYDMIPPCIIHDLTVSGLLPYRHTVILTWTATGDDMDTGQVDHYELFVGQDIKDIRDIIRFSETGTHNGPGKITLESHPVTWAAGNKETLLWEPDMHTRTSVYAFAVRGVDNVGQMAPVSNIVAASLSFIN